MGRYRCRRDGATRGLAQSDTRGEIGDLRTHNQRDAAELEVWLPDPGECPLRQDGDHTGDRH